MSAAAPVLAIDRALLAIDPGSICGWAVRTSAGVVASGVWNLAPRRGDSPGIRYLKLRSRLTDVKDRFPGLDVVAVEQAHHRGGAATEYAIGIVTHVQSWCAEVGVEHLVVHGRHVKKLATGRGNADKAAIIAAAERRWPGWSPATDDEADARWIAEAAAHELAAPSAVSRNQGAPRA